MLELFFIVSFATAIIVPVTLGGIRKELKRIADCLEDEND